MTEKLTWMAQDVSIELHRRKLKVKHLRDGSVVALGFTAHNAARKAYRRIVKGGQVVTLRPAGFEINIVPVGSPTAIVMEDA